MNSAEWLSDSEIRCNVPALAMTMRGNMTTDRSLMVFLAAKHSTGFRTQVSTLPDIHLLPPVQILRVEPEIMAVVERNDTSSVPLLYLRVFGEEHFLKHAARSRTKRPGTQGVSP
ncbi:unnamed protein product [Symbiodinium necroappetens]|uniref:Uncharacterized protein n=1 Tax=Symbiodinium necroappetens TaxID=1628268 RepID=A0A812KXP8_9DINO|nr:unnamed protein product [Symbiodinium necroappetens]